MFALVKNGKVQKYPYSLAALKEDNPNTSFAKDITDADLQEFGVYRVYFSTPPSVSSKQQLQEDIPVFDLAAQRWTQVWRVQDLSGQELELREQDLSKDIRGQRNVLLTESDWTQLQDSPVDRGAWAQYRQALRDIPAQPDFPWSVQWPAKPE